MEKYKTMQQLNTETNIGFFCKCYNSGVNSFTGNCDRCGMVKKLSKQGEVDKEELQLLIDKLKDKLKEIEKLVSSNPNDQELGNKLRKILNRNNVGE